MEAPDAPPIEAPDTVRAFLADVSSTNGGSTIVNEVPRLDLDLYIQNYVGRTRFDRLLFIGKTSLPLCVDALKAALVEAKQGNDQLRYIEVCECLARAAPYELEAHRDDGWINRTQAANKAEAARLEAELKGYRNNLIKESIRMGNEDLGKYYESIGRLQEALEAYARMRQDVSSTKHIIDYGKRIANVSLQRRDWATALSSVTKTTGLQSFDDEKSHRAFVHIVSALSHLGTGRYEDAAQNLIQIDSAAPPGEYAHVVSPNDIAVHGGLTALATMKRGHLQKRVLENQSFRIFLEQEPHVRKAISLFVNARYAKCLAILDAAKPDFLLDMYLHKHVADLYARIRSKCIVQFCEPFSCVTMASLEDTFGHTGPSLEPELVRMILEGQLKARIDSKQKLLVAVRPDPRVDMQTEALRVTHEYEREAKERLRRANLVAARLEIVGSPKRPASGQAGPGFGNDETWHDGSGSGSGSGKGLAREPAPATGPSGLSSSEIRA